MLLTSDAQPLHGQAMPDRPYAQLLEHFFARKWTILGAALAGMVLSGIALCFVTPRYTGEAVIVIDSRRNKVAEAESALTGLVREQPALRSEVDLLRSPDIARYVIAKLDLMSTKDYSSRIEAVPAADRFAEAGRWIARSVPAVAAALGIAVPRPEDTAEPVRPQPTDASERRMQRAIVLFERDLDIANDPKSLTIRVHYRTSSPQLAAAVPNAVIERYLELGRQARTETAERNRAWLVGRVAEMRAAVDAADHALEDYRAQHALATRRDRDPLQEEMLVLRTRLADARVELARASARAEQLEHAGRDAADRAALPEVLASDLVRTLRQQEALQQARLSEVQATYGPKHPNTTQARSTVLDIHSRITAEINRIASAIRTELAEAQAREASLRGSIQELQQRINTANAADVTLRALEQDAAIARTVLDGFIRRYNENLGAPIAVSDGRVIAHAIPPAVPSSPKYGLTLLLATVLSGGLAFAASAVRMRLRSGFTTQREMAEALGMTVAGSVPMVPALRRHRFAAAAESLVLRDTAVAVRAMAPRVSSMAARGKVLVIASSVPGEGKSTFAVSVARSAANAGQRCLLVDGDVRRPWLHRMLQLDAAPGLVELSAANAGPAHLQTVPGERFLFLAAGHPTEDPLQPFEMEGFERLLAELRETYDAIVIDAPPLLAAPEALVLSSHADLNLFLVKWRSTRKDLARKAAELLKEASSGPCLGVLSQVNISRLDRRELDRAEEAYRAHYRNA